MDASALPNAINLLAPHDQGSTCATAPLLGREDQITEICELLATADCRLLTLLGPGGIGKTRLATEVLNHLDTPSVLVPLDEVKADASTDSAELAALALAQRLGIPLTTNSPARQQVLQSLKSSHFLVVLDDFEHLLPAAHFLTELLEHAPGLKILVTSRVRLNITAERLIEIEGLSTQASGVSAAVQLFAYHVEQRLATFETKQHDYAIRKICHLLEGSPLAISLAAGLIGERSPEAIADRLVQGIDVLLDADQKAISRNASMHGVIDSSWQQLSHQHRQAFARLTMFDGGFSATAADEVARCDTRSLAALVDRGWIRLEQTRTAVRYAIHPLLQSFGQGRLANNISKTDSLAVGLQSRHAHYYTALLLSHAPALQVIDDEAFYQIDLDLPNLRLAWSWLQAECEPTAIGPFVEALHFYWVFKGARHDAIAMLEAAITLPSISAAERSDWSRLLKQCYYPSERINRDLRTKNAGTHDQDRSFKSSDWQLSLALPPLAALELEEQLFGAHRPDVKPWAADQGFIVSRLGTIGFLSAKDPIKLLNSALRTGRFARQRFTPAGTTWSNGYLAVLFRSFGMHRLANGFANEATRQLDNLDGDAFSFIACQSLCVSEIMAAHWSSAQALLDHPFTPTDEVLDWRLTQDCVALRGIIGLATGRTATAIENWQSLIDSGQARGDALVELWGLLGLLETRLRAGLSIDNEQFKRAGLLTEPSDTQGQARLLAIDALAQWQAGNAAPASQLALQALKMLQSCRFIAFYTAQACSNTAWVLTQALLSNDPDTAIENLREQAGQAEKILTQKSRANRFIQARAAINRGNLAHYDQREQRAKRLWQLAGKIASRFDQATDAQNAKQFLTPDR